ncbi:MAG: arginine--tRNA ligase [Chloroflexi bacterium]|nr:MAG: arginine--tRNA ligase [Chloroflexota bacterium]
MERGERGRRDPLGSDPLAARTGRVHGESRDARHRVRPRCAPDLAPLRDARAEWRRWRAPARCPRLAGVTPPLRDQVAAAIQDGLVRASKELGWPGVDGVPIEVERPANPEHGDYASNVALKLAKQARKPPREIAKAIRERVRIAPPIAAVEDLNGFVNVRLDERWLAAQVDEIVRAGPDFGRSKALAGKRMQVEFISANPTGPLTVANARGGPLGDVLSSVLEFAGATVEREYYVEDTGTQFDTFGRSIAIRYRQLHGEQIEIPADAYPAEYVKDIAAEIQARDGDKWMKLALEEQAKSFAALGVEWVLREAKRVTAMLGIRYDTWFSQAEMMRSGYFDKTLAELRKLGKVYDKDGAVWFEASEAVDDKEGWVVVRSNGEPGYLGKDIAYHVQSLRDRRFDKKIDIWGSNTHYHLIQMRAAMQALGLLEKFEVVLYQYVRFLHEGVLKRMGRRTGQFLLLEEVIEAVGKDATRYFFLQSSADRQLDFDLELAVQQSNENPVYYVQYAHARIASILRTAAERGMNADGAETALLTAKGELDLIRLVLRFPELVDDVRQHYGVHQLTTYALELAGAFHGFYRDHRVVDEADVARSKARLRLVQAVQVALRQTLGLLGVSAPDRM